MREARGHELTQVLACSRSTAGLPWWSLPDLLLPTCAPAGIEEIGVQIEMPFITLPLKDIVRDIEKDLSAIVLSRKEVRRTLPPPHAARS